MTENIYIKFCVTPWTPEFKRQNEIWRRIAYVIFFFIPKANPGFDKIAGDVAEWQLEIHSVDKIAIREIGIDINKRVIVIMPWGDNYGSWTDNEMTLDEYRNQYEVVDIDKSEFNKNWDWFAKLNP